MKTYAIAWMDEGDHSVRTIVYAKDTPHAAIRTYYSDGVDERFLNDPMGAPRFDSSGNAAAWMVCNRGKRCLVEPDAMRALFGDRLPIAPV